MKTKERFKSASGVDRVNMKRGVSGIYVLIILVFLVLTTSPIASAGVFGWFKKTITGYATSGTTNITVSVSGASPVLVKVENGTLTGTVVDPTDNNLTVIIFYLTLNDADGVNDINDTSIRANFSNTGETLRQNTSCSLVGDLNATAANYSCSINMWYYDENGIWTINAGGTDLGNATFFYDTAKTFQYDQLQAIRLGLDSVTFPSVSPGSTNQNANNDPIVVNNTGNYNITSGNVRITAIDLSGQTIATQFIFTGNFSAGNNTGSDAECGATSLVNGTATSITNSTLLRGNHSANNGQTGQEQLYLCIKKVPTDISSQTYSTSTGGAWTIGIV